MSKGDLQFAADVLLINKISTMDAALSKQAGLGDTAMGLIQSMVSALKNEVQTRVEKEGIFAAVTYFLMGRMGFFFRIIMALADSIGGISAGGILKSMWDSLESKVRSGEPISPQEVNELGKRAVQQHITTDDQEADDMMSFSNDMLCDLRKVESEGKIVRLAIRGGFLIGLLRTLNPLRARWMIGGLIVLFVKTVLWGAGLLTISGAAKKMMTGEEDEEEEESGSAYTVPKAHSKAPESRIKPLSWAPPKVSHGLTPTGQGQTYFSNDWVTKIWSVPIRGGLRNSMIMWAGYVYGDFKGQGNLIVSTPAFNIMVSNLNQYVESSGYFITVPPNFHSIKEIVDHFVGQTARKLKRETDEAA